MSTPVSQDFATINARRLEIRKEEGRADDDARTAIGSDLDAVAAGEGLTRTAYEADDHLRQRVLGVRERAR